MMHLEPEPTQRSTSSRRRIAPWAWVVLVLCIVAIATPLYQRATYEPRFQGKFLSTWLNDYDSKKTNSTLELKRAVQGMGSTAMPYLLREIHRTEPASISWLRRHYESFFQKTLPWRGSRNRQAAAIVGVQALGNSAHSYLIRELQASEPPLLGNRATGERKIAALIALASLSEVPDSALPFLVSALEDTTFHPVSHYIYISLNKLPPSLLKPIVPNVIKAASFFPQGEHFAMESLAWIGSPRIEDIPVLIDHLKHTNRAVQASACFGLALINPNFANAMRVRFHARSSSAESSEAKWSLVKQRAAEVRPVIEALAVNQNGYFQAAALKIKEILNE